MGSAEGDLSALGLKRDPKAYHFINQGNAHRVSVPELYVRVGGNCSSVVVMVNSIPLVRLTLLMTEKTLTLSGTP